MRAVRVCWVVLAVGGCAIPPEQDENVGSVLAALAFSGGGVLLDGSLNTSAACVGSQAVVTANGSVLAAAPPASNVELTADVGSNPTAVFTAILPGDFVFNGSEFEASYSIGIDVPDGPVSVSICLQDADLTQQVCFPPIGFHLECDEPPPPSDTTAPSITGSVAPAANANGWNDSDVVVSFVCEDESGGSGIASCTAPVTLSSEGAGQSALGNAADNAGNMASTSVGPINIDKTAPSISITGATAYTVDQRVEVHCEADDSLSGIASTTCTDVSADAWSLALGSHEASGSATDNAGNEANASATYSVSATTESVCALLTLWVPNPQIADSMCNKLRRAEQLKNAGQTSQANALISSVQNQLRRTPQVQNLSVLLMLTDALR